MNLDRQRRDGSPLALFTAGYCGQVALLRLFAAAREAAGISSVALPGDTVGEVLAEAQRHFGEPFSTVLQSARVWLNGLPATLGQAAGNDDEISVLPPVSGG